MEKGSDVYRITPDSSPEHLRDWDSEDLATLHARLTSEMNEHASTLATIDRILTERTEEPLPGMEVDG